MTQPQATGHGKAVDSIQHRISDYACALRHQDLTPEAIHLAKARTIDTLGVLICSFCAEPARLARGLAAQMPDAAGSTIIGSRMKTSPDMAAFVNASTARYMELTDLYHWPGRYASHPSDVITPMLAAGEHAQVSGRELILGIVLAYEVYLRFADVFHNPDFDYTNFGCVGNAVGAAKLFGLSREQISHAIAMAVVPNNILTQVRLSHLSMFKALAAGQSGRAGVFAAMLARAGMQGPHLPFEGRAGWCEHVARERLVLEPMGGNGVPFRILDTRMKHRPSCGQTIPSILAAEKIAPMRDLKNIKRVIVEVYQFAKQQVATGEHRWNPDTRESADHSNPYAVAATLMDGTITPRSFNDAHLWNPELRTLMQKIEVVENEEFTRGYDRVPPEHRARVTVITEGGEKLVGESGGSDDHDDMSEHTSDAQIEEKFRGLTEDLLGAKRAKAILNRLWHLDELDNVAAIPRDFVVA